MKDKWLENFLKNPDIRAKLYLFLWIAHICVILSIAIGMIIFLLIVLNIF